MNEDMMNFADALSQNDALKPLNDIIEQIMEMPESELNDTNVEMMVGMIKGAFTEKMMEDSIAAVIEGFDNDNLTRARAMETVASTKEEMTGLIDTLQPSENKRKILESVFNIFYNIFDAAMERYHNYSINLPIKLDNGAHVPTYAHDTDAAADLYVKEDVVLPAHSLSNLIDTGVHIQLPENWVAYVVPRSSIGLKTGLRLSNSAGVIDSSYRGGIGVIYDNISDSDYTVHAGDRIAQLIIAPVHHFKANVVDILESTERGEGGYGSTGK